MSFLTHLECSVPCGAPPRDPRQANHLCACGMPLRGALRPRRPPRAAGAGEPRGPRAHHVAVPRADAARRRRGAGDAGRGLHAADPRAAAGPRARADEPLHQGRVAQPDQLLQGARAVGGRHQGAHLGATNLSVPSAGNAANAMAAYAAARRARGQGLHAEGREGPVHPRVRALRRGRHAGRRPHHRRGPHRGGARQAAGLVRRLHAQGALPHRRQEDDGVRAGRAAGLALPDWIIYPTGGGIGIIGMWKAFEEMEQLGWVPRGKRPQMVGVQAEHCAPIPRAFEQGAERSEMWQNARRAPTGCACPRPSATS